MSVADVERFWERMRGFGGSTLFYEFRRTVLHAPPDEVARQVIALASREGFNFSAGDYRAAVLSDIDAQPNAAQDLVATYRRLVGEGRWFEVIDGVVVGG